jgi:hypothetical protein
MAENSLSRKEIRGFKSLKASGKRVEKLNMAATNLMYDQSIWCKTEFTKKLRVKWILKQSEKAQKEFALKILPLTKYRDKDKDVFKNLRNKHKELIKYAEVIVFYNKMQLQNLNLNIENLKSELKKEEKVSNDTKKSIPLAKFSPIVKIKQHPTKTGHSTKNPKPLKNRL